MLSATLKAPSHCTLYNSLNDVKLFQQSYQTCHEKNWSLFVAQMMARFENRIHQLIQHLLTLVHPLNVGLEGAPNIAPKWGLNWNPVAEVNPQEKPTNVHLNVDPEIVRLH